MEPSFSEFVETHIILFYRSQWVLSYVVLMLDERKHRAYRLTDPRSPIVRDDQSTSSSWWQEDISDPVLEQQSSDIADNTNFFTSTHGLVQTHPLGSASGNLPGQQPGYRTIDFGQRGLLELKRNPSLSNPEECARACREDEPPKICYYHFTLELYNVLGA